MDPEEISENEGGDSRGGNNDDSKELPVKVALRVRPLSEKEKQEKASVCIRYEVFILRYVNKNETNLPLELFQTQLKLL